MVIRHQFSTNEHFIHNMNMFCSHIYYDYDFLCPNFINNPLWPFGATDYRSGKTTSGIMLRYKTTSGFLAYMHMYDTGICFVCNLYLLYGYHMINVHLIISRQVLSQVHIGFIMVISSVSLYWFWLIYDNINIDMKNEINMNMKNEMMNINVKQI